MVPHRACENSPTVSSAKAICAARATSMVELVVPRVAPEMALVSLISQVLQCPGIPWLLYWQCCSEVDSSSWLLSARQPKVPLLSPCTLQLLLCKNPLHVARTQQGLPVWPHARMFQAPAMPLRHRVALLKMLRWSVSPSAAVHEVHSGVQPQWPFGQAGIQLQPEAEQTEAWQPKHT